MASKKKGTVVALPRSGKQTVPIDPLQVNNRLYKQVSEVLKQLEEGEHVTLKERFQALMAIARIQYVFVNLRKEKAADPDVGSTVRKYTAAFAKNDAGRGKKGAGPAPEPGPAPDPGEQWWDDDDDDNAA